MNNILIINSSTLPLPPVKGGAVENLIDLFLKDNEEKKRYKITIVCKYDEKAEACSKTYKQCEFIWINTNSVKYKFFRIVTAFFRKLTKKYIDNPYMMDVKKKIKYFDKYDLVISENVAEFGLSLRSKINGKFVLHLHNDILNKNTNQAKEILDCFDECWCLSKFIMNRVKEIENSGKIKVLYNGIDLSKFNIDISEKEKIEIKRTYGINQENKVIMYSGRIVPEKGVLELIRAFNLMEDRDKVTLLIVGAITNKTKYEKAIMKLIRENNYIVNTGYVDYELISKLYNIADVGVVPSTWEEPFALTVTEFMASGKPLVVTKSGAIPELVDSKYTIMVDNDEKIEENLSKALKNALNLKVDENIIKKDSNKFSSEKYCDMFNTLICQIVNGRDEKYEK